MKVHMFLFFLLNTVCINIIRAELCHKTTTVSPYFRYHKCPTTDMVFMCDNCDAYQPSCSSDSECGNGDVCCKASCSPSSCYKCEGFLMKCLFYYLLKLTLIILQAKCPPQNISTCEYGFKCEIGAYGGCFICQCLPDVCGYSDEFIVSLNNLMLIFR
jgi:hypothetical protein